MASTATAGVRQRRRVIQRPRLLALLDESKTRVRTLVAPAGYGKTTLAEQWVHAERPSRRLVHRTSIVDGRRGAGSRTGSSCRRVSSPAATSACASIFARSPARRRRSTFLQRSSARTSQPGRATAGSSSTTIRRSARAEEAERLVERSLQRQRPIQLLIASRQRPSWVSSPADPLRRSARAEPDHAGHGRP